MQTFIKTLNPEPVNKKNALRFAHCKSETEEISRLFDFCAELVTQNTVYKVCYCEVPLSITENLCDFGAFSVLSSGLAKNLEGCKKAVIFAATLGCGIDRLITRFSHTEPSKAVMIQAIGAERIEALCDEFCKTLCSKRTRFSPGYSDLSLDVQKHIFNLLGCEKNIGLTLNDTMLMSPSKSVTAFVGIE